MKKKKKKNKTLLTLNPSANLADGLGVEREMLPPENLGNAGTDFFTEGPGNTEKSRLVIFDDDFERRYRNRELPLIDSNIREADIKRPSKEALDHWYAANHIGRYVHMEEVTRDGVTFKTKRVQFEFSRMLNGYSDNIDEHGVSPAIAKISFADVSKVSFLNNIETPLRYINAFINDYDPDDELMSIYFTLMFSIMYKEVELDPLTFINNVYASFTSETLIEKIRRMVNYNTEEEGSRMSDRTFNESIQMTFDHLRAIMGVSCLHKFAIPIVSHYYKVRGELLAKAGMTDKELYYYTLASFLPVFDDVYGVNLENKMYYTATTRVTKTTNQDSAMWKRVSRIGVTPVSHANTLMRNVVVDISQKALFSKSAIVYINVCMDRGIRDMLGGRDKYDFSEMPMESSDSVNEKMTKWDRWQTDKSFHSQKDRIRAHVSVKDAIDRFGKKFGLDFKRMRSKHPKDVEATRAIRDEFCYYRDNIHLPFNPTQIYLIQLYFSTLVGNAEDGNTLEPDDIIKVIMIMKRDLSSQNFTYMPFFITGQVDAAAIKGYNKRRIKTLVESHSLYDSLKAEYKSAESVVNWDRILAEILVYVACPIRIVDFDHPELCDRLMRPDEMSTIDEMMRFHDSL